MRVVVVMVDGQPARVWHDEVQAQGDATKIRDADEGAKLELWDVPVGRSVGPPEQVAWGDE